MSAVAISAPSRRVTSPSAARLIGVELRKMTDTRAGAWLLAIITLAGLALTSVVMVIGEPADRSLAEFFSIAQLAVAVLLPIVGILAVTSEWSQRTALTTFALEPRRSRVIGAKLAASVVLVVMMTVVMLAVAASVNAIAVFATDASGSWSLAPSLFGEAVLLQLTGVLVGIAFALSLLSSPLAIVMYFVLPTVRTVLGGVVSALETPAQWLDLTSTTAPLMEGSMTGEQWAQLGTSMALWFAVPLVLGLIRVLRTEVK